ncbi:SH3 domain-binding glutamic acid-rich-like protein 3 [Brachionichthys hirsutus]|uniref:SH3 domain-binding glutamic acid-rich-like protein 3 n=1 Tax=Brachionichthys hirsutus TaxID=412623 RepID=UPI003604B34C
MSDIKVYYSSVTCDIMTKKRQSHIFLVLDSKKVKYERLDVCSDPDMKIKMRELAENPNALPPQIVNGSDYCGNYEAFNEAVECSALMEFLKLPGLKQ